MATKKTKPVKVGKNTEVGYKKPPKDTRWKPGQSGNPKGRPRSRTLSEAYRAMLRQPLPDDPSRTYADAVAETLCKNAVLGDVVAAKELADRTEGRSKQTVDVTVEERKREMVENAIAKLIEDAQMSRDEAIEQLTAVTPEISAWIN